MANLHDTDFYSWTEQQAGLLRSGNFADLDIANLIDEIEDMGWSEKRILEHRLEILLVYLLKWRYQPEHRGRSLQAGIKIQRHKIDRLLRDSLSLKSKMANIIIEIYEIAILIAAPTTGLDEGIFPAECPWNFTQVMDDKFWLEKDKYDR
ncbi:hypothetical protein TI03_01760 [Achromatium sp. WMS1]|nr:hypothetical protein TI03_01760 [Achromatium sp. WMS1]